MLLILGTIAGAGGATSTNAGLTTSHGYAVFGELKYGPGFTHLSYTNPDAPKGGIYRYNGGTTFDSLNHFSILGTFPWVVIEAFDPLMERSLDEPASYYGVIARTITYPKDLSWVEFELRPEARWVDGKPITVDDVLFTLEAFRNKLVNPRYGAAGRVVTRAWRTGPNRVRMELNQKNNPTLPAIVAGMKVLPRHFFEKRNLGEPSLDIPVTSGPYRVGKVVPGRRLDMVRVRDYWGADLPMRKGRFNFDTVRHIFFRDQNAQIEAFDAGLIDMRQETNSRRWAMEKSMPAFASGDIQRSYIRYRNAAYYSSMTINSRTPFLSDRRVRQAIVLAYDFEFVRRGIMHGAHDRTESYFTNTDFEARGAPSPGELKLLEPYRDSLPPAVFGTIAPFPKAGTRESQRRNLKQARDLLAEAGYHIRDGKLIDPRTGGPVRLRLVALSPLYVMQAGYFMKNMKRLGIEVNYRNYDTSQFRYLAGNHHFDLLIDLPAYPVQDTPGVELISPWSSQSADTPNLLNYAGVKEPAIDHAVQAVIEATDRQAVVDGMRAIDRVARANFYSVPMQHTYPSPVGEFPISYWNRFGRPAGDPVYNYPFRIMDYWWWDPKKEARLSHGAFE